MSSRKWSLTAGERRRISEKEPVLTRLSGLHRAKHQYRSSQNSFTITPGQNDRDIPLSSYYPTPKRRAAVQSVHTSVKVLAALVATHTYSLSQQDWFLGKMLINSSTSLLYLLWQTFPQIKHTYKQDPILDLGGLRARSHLVSTSSLMDPLFIGCCSDEAYLDWE